VTDDRDDRQPEQHQSGQLPGPGASAAAASDLRPERPVTQAPSLRIPACSLSGRHGRPAAGGPVPDAGGTGGRRKDSRNMKPTGTPPQAESCRTTVTVASDSRSARESDSESAGALASGRGGTVYPSPSAGESRAAPGSL
jgi:hypothetical protein